MKLRSGEYCVLVSSVFHSFLFLLVIFLYCIAHALCGDFRAGHIKSGSCLRHALFGWSHCANNISSL
jgi:hypothetical protein